MKVAALPVDEARRQAVLDALDILDSEPETAFDDLVALASRLCDVPIALISLVDRERQWFKSRHGLEARGTPRSVSFCAHAILDPAQPLVVPDAWADERFADNPLVTGPEQLRFYAGVPLCTEEGTTALGTLCVIDRVPRRLDAGQLSALQAIARQAASQMLLRQALRRRTQSYAALNAAAQETARARDLAERASRLKSDFIANISHELRTPLQLILGFAELGATRVASPEMATSLFSDIGRAGGQMLTLVNDLLDLAKLESGVMTLQREPSDVAAIAADVVRDMQPLADSRDQRIRFTAEPGPLTADVDRFRFEQVLRNVLANAIRLAPVGSAIEVQMNAAGSAGVELRVADRGPGIPAQDLERIFDAFEQSSTTRTGAGGTGLGLAICRRIMSAHGGTIRAENRDGGGAVFVIGLP